MGVAVRKSSPVVVRPSEPVTTTATSGTIKLTSFDKGFVRLPFTALLVFEHLNHDAVETLKRALSQALVHYSPFCGRITPGPAADDGEVYLQCTGEGAEFVAASAACGLKEAGIFDGSPGTRALVDELAVFYPAGSYSPSDPLLSVQVTEFTCGGLVLGVTWNHAVADGAGIAQFLVAVGELARGLPSPSVVPVRWDGSVSSRPPSFDAVLQATLMHPGSLDLLVTLDVTVPSSSIGRIKAEFRSRFGGPPCTVFEVALAVLWRCRTRAVKPDPGAPAFFSFAANVRKHVGAEDGYYGNCVANQLLVMATSRAVADADIVDLVRMIKRAKDQIQIPGQLEKKEEKSGEELLRGLGGRYDMLHVSSWRNIGFEQVDLGSGAPAGVMFHGRGTPPVPTCVMLPPCKGKDGVNVLSVSVTEEHADALLGEVARHK